MEEKVVFLCESRTLFFREAIEKMEATKSASRSKVFAEYRTYLEDKSKEWERYSHNC